MTSNPMEELREQAAKIADVQAAFALGMAKDFQSSGNMSRSDAWAEAHEVAKNIARLTRAMEAPAPVGEVNPIIASLVRDAQALGSDEAADDAAQRIMSYVAASAMPLPAPVALPEAGEDGVQIDIGELAAAIRVNLYRHVPNMPSYPVGIVEKVLKAALHGDQEG